MNGRGLRSRRQAGREPIGTLKALTLVLRKTREIRCLDTHVMR